MKHDIRIGKARWEMIRTSFDTGLDMPLLLKSKQYDDYNIYKSLDSRKFPNELQELIDGVVEDVIVIRKGERWEVICEDGKSYLLVGRKHKTAGNSYKVFDLQNVTFCPAPSLREIADYYGVSYSYIRNKSYSEGWVEERDARLKHVRAKELDKLCDIGLRAFMTMREKHLERVAKMEEKWSDEFDKGNISVTNKDIMNAMKHEAGLHKVLMNHSDGNSENNHLAFMLQVGIINKMSDNSDDCGPIIDLDLTEQ